MGLYNAGISLRMKEAGFSDTVLGAASGLFFLGVVIVAPMAGYVARRQSQWGVLAIGLALIEVGATRFPMAQSLEHWSLFRLVLVAGIGICLMHVSRPRSLTPPYPQESFGKAMKPAALFTPSCTPP